MQATQGDDMNRLPEDPDKRRGALLAGQWYLERMRKQDSHHARLYCPEHVNYIGAGGVFPCVDCEEERGVAQR